MPRAHPSRHGYRRARDRYATQGRAENRTNANLTLGFGHGAFGSRNRDCDYFAMHEGELEECVANSHQNKCRGFVAPLQSISQSGNARRLWHAGC